MSRGADGHHRPSIQGNDGKRLIGGTCRIAALDLKLIGGSERRFRSLRAVLGWEVTTYDALYVLLAVDLDAELITADTRLAEFARRRSLPVRPLSG